MTDLTHFFISGSHLWGLYNLGIIRYIYAYPHYFDKIKDIGGVSFGAITAYFIILNIDITRIEKLFYKLVEMEEFKLIPYEKLIDIIYEKGIQDVSIYFDIFEEELNEHENIKNTASVFRPAVMRMRFAILFVLLFVVLFFTRKDNSDGCNETVRYFFFSGFHVLK